jgi:putative ABC transport system permease protein
VSPKAIAKAGFTVRTDSTQLIASTSRIPTQAEEDRFQQQLNTLGIGGGVEHGAQIQIPVELWIIMAAAALITLGAAGIGTGLAAADGRADLSTLAAVGASPRLRRGLSLSQSAVIAGLGSVLGAAAGLGAAIAVLVALNQGYADIWPGPTPRPIAIPWLSLTVALLVVPLVAILGAGMLTRSRLPIERRI